MGAQVTLVVLPGSTLIAEKWTTCTNASHHHQHRLRKQGLAPARPPREMIILLTCNMEAQCCFSHRCAAAIGSARSNVLACTFIQMGIGINVLFVFYRFCGLFGATLHCQRLISISISSFTHRQHALLSLSFPIASPVKFTHRRTACTAAGKAKCCLQCQKSPVLMPICRTVAQREIWLLYQLWVGVDREGGGGDERDRRCGGGVKERDERRCEEEVESKKAWGESWVRDWEGMRKGGEK